MKCEILKYEQLGEKRRVWVRVEREDGSNTTEERYLDDVQLDAVKNDDKAIVGICEDIAADVLRYLNEVSPLATVRDPVPVEMALPVVDASHIEAKVGKK